MSMETGEPELWKRVLRLIDSVGEKEKSCWSYSSGSTEDILVSGAPASLDPETLTAPERRMLFFRWIEQKLQEVVDEEERADLEDCVDLFRTRTLYLTKEFFTSKTCDEIHETLSVLQFCC